MFFFFIIIIFLLSFRTLGGALRAFDRGATGVAVASQSRACVSRLFGSALLSREKRSHGLLAPNSGAVGRARRVSVRLRACCRRLMPVSKSFLVR